MTGGWSQRRDPHFEDEFAFALQPALPGKVTPKLISVAFEYDRATRTADLYFAYLCEAEGTAAVDEILANRAFGGVLRRLCQRQSRGGRRCWAYDRIVIGLIMAVVVP